MFALSTPSLLSLYTPTPSSSSSFLATPTHTLFSPLPSPIVRLAFPPRRGDVLAAACEDGSVWVWRDGARGHDPVEKLLGSGGGGDDEKVGGLAVDDSEGLVVIWSRGSKIFVHDAKSNTPLKQLQHFDSPITGLSLSSDGQLLAAGHESGQIIIFNCQHGSHQIIKLDKSSQLPIAFAQLHPTRRNILLLLFRSSSTLLVYDTLRPSSPHKIISLLSSSAASLSASTSASSFGNPTALAFHPAGTHVCIVTDAGMLVTANIEAGTVRSREMKVPLTGVGWTSKTEVVLGTETGRVLRRDVNDPSVSEDVVVDSDGDPILCLVMQPTLPPSSRARQVSAATKPKVLADSNRPPASSQCAIASSHSKKPSSSLTHHTKQLSTPSGNPNISTVHSLANTTYNHSPTTSANPTATTNAINSYLSSRKFPAPSSSALEREPSSGSGSGAGIKRSSSLATKKTLAFADDPSPQQPLATLPEASSSRSYQEEDASPRPLSPAHTISSHPSSSSSIHHQSSNNHYTPSSQAQADSPLIYAISAQVRDLHLDLLRSRRQAKNELRSGLEKYLGEEVRQLRRENEELRREVARLRRGY